MNPCVPMPCSPTPAGPTRQAIRRSRRGPRYVHNEGSHDNNSFGAQSHGLGTCCLRFVTCLATGDARLASRCWPLYGAGLVTRRIPTKGFRTASYISSSLLKLSWRKDILNCFSVEQGWGSRRGVGARVALAWTAGSTQSVFQVQLSGDRFGPGRIAEGRSSPDAAAKALEVFVEEWNRPCQLCPLPRYCLRSPPMWAVINQCIQPLSFCRPRGGRPRRGRSHG
jgi:hypothetical protein